MAEIRKHLVAMLLAVRRPRLGIRLSTTDSRQNRRYVGLDGLRGLAALAVVFSHLVPLAPSLHVVTLEEWHQPLSPAQDWLTYSPVHLWWLGTEAVYLFFVLSGFVLALPFVRTAPSGRTPDGFWRSYYPSRLVRLYLPIWASLLLALVLVQTVGQPENLPPGLPYSADHHTPGAMLWHGLVLFGTGSLNLPLWSLKWELWFSLLLPVYVAAARLVRRPVWTAIVLVACFGLITVGLRSGVGALQFMPVFMLGVVIAFRLDDVRGACAWLGNRVPVAMPALLAVGILLATARWTVLGLTGSEGPPVLVATVWSILGVTLIMVSVLAWKPAAAGLSRRPAQFLGDRSYSLYLVHLPVVTALTAVIGVDRYWLLLPVCLVASFVATEVFYRLVERPAHRLARRIRNATRVRPAALAGAGSESG